MNLRKMLIIYVIGFIMVLPIFSQETQIAAFSNTPTIINNDDALKYLTDLFEKFPNRSRSPWSGEEIGGGIFEITDQIRLYNPLNKEKIDCVTFSWREERIKIDEKTNYPINVDISLSINVPFSIYLRNYRETLSIDNTEQLFELLRQSNKFLLHVKTGINLVGNNFEVIYSSPGYISIHREIAFLRDNPYFVFRRLLDVENHTFPNFNLLDLTNRETVANSLSRLLTSNRPYGFNNGKFILFAVSYPVNKTFININKIGDNPPFNIQHYKQAITSGIYQTLFIDTNNFIVELNILFNDTDRQMLEKLPKSNELDQLAGKSRFRFTGSYYYIGMNDFIAFLKRSIEFNIKIKKSPWNEFNNENDLFVEFKTHNFYLIPYESQSLTEYYNDFEFRQIVTPLETINTAIENEIKYVWKNDKWDYE